MNIGFIYVMHVREFYLLNKSIYKIGRTKDPKTRFGQYPNGSKLKFIIQCEDCIPCETQLIKIMKKKFLHMDKIGNEYFSGKLKDIINIINKYVTEFNKKYEKDEKVRLEIESTPDIKSDDELEFEDDDELEFEDDIESDNEFERFDEADKTEVDNKKDLKKDLKKDIKYMCKKCFKTFKYKCYYIKHLDKKLPCTKPICEKCGKQFTKTYFLKRHLMGKKDCSKKLQNMKFG